MLQASYNLTQCSICPVTNLFHICRDFKYWKSFHKWCNANKWTECECNWDCYIITFDEGISVTSLMILPSNIKYRYLRHTTLMVTSCVTVNDATIKFASVAESIKWSDLRQKKRKQSPQPSFLNCWMFSICIRCLRSDLVVTSPRDKKNPVTALVLSSHKQITQIETVHVFSNTITCHGALPPHDSGSDECTDTD